MADAVSYSGVDDKSKLINLALDQYVKRMAAKRLVALGGSMPDLVVPARNSGRMLDDTSPAREAARALVALGGSMPDLEEPVRRQAGLAAGDAGLSKVAEEPAVYGAKDKEGKVP